MATQLGLILVELLTNTIKYARPPETGGVICLAMSRDGGTCRLVYRDNGCGTDGEPRA